MVPPVSQVALTFSNPLRTIAHCDIDSAYALLEGAQLEFERVRRDLPDDTPLITIQWETILAVNYRARAFGITRNTPIADARNLCPDLVVAHVATWREGDSEPQYRDDPNVLTDKVNLDQYRRLSGQIMEVFKDVAPDAIIEKASIDEAFIDLTPMVLDKLRSDHAQVWSEFGSSANDQSLPPAPLIESENWSGWQAVHTADDETVEDKPSTWQDWALLYGAEIMLQMRTAVQDRLGFTCSAGITHNKAMSKLCSAWKKPAAQTVLRESDVLTCLKTLPIKKIRSLGRKTGTELETEYKVTTVGQLWATPLKDLRSFMGSDGNRIWHLIRGTDFSPVVDRTSVASMLASKNVRPAVRSQEAGLPWIRLLAGELYCRLKEAQTISEGIWPRTISLKYRLEEFTWWSFDPLNPKRPLEHSVQAPFSRNRVLHPNLIEEAAVSLWTDLHRRPQGGPAEVHNFSLTLNGLTPRESGQKTLVSFLASSPAKRIRTRSPTISFDTGNLGLNQLDPQISNQTDANISSPSSRFHLTDSPDRDDASSWVCPECDQVFSEIADVSGKDILLIRLEHLDFHLASRLQQDFDTSRLSGSSIARSSQHRADKQRDIRNFFGKAG